jgi:hypothetical protein
MKQTAISRRTMLRGLGTILVLPFLESALPATRSLGAQSAIEGPRRLAWIYVPNGMDMETWTPKKLGADYDLSSSLNTLAAYKDRMLVVSGLVCDKANSNGDGPGDHARANAAYLTGQQPQRGDDASPHLGKSADQAAADLIGGSTKFASLELGMEDARDAASDSGYSIAYSHNLSWRNATTPMIKDCDPRSVFDRLFSNGNPLETAETKARREEDRKSVLDFVLQDANTLKKNLMATDRDKMDEYLTAVREIELRMERGGNTIARPAGAQRPPPFDASARKKAGLFLYSSDYDHRARLMIDMLVLAFQADLTRVITLPFADEGSNQTYPWAGADVPHHGTSHHMGDPKKKELVAKINTYHLSLLKYLLEKLDRIKEGNGSILDNSLIAYGSGNSDGQRHNHDNLPLILLGNGGGTIRTGRHIDATGTPINNLWLAMLKHAGASEEKLGDSTGCLALA